MTFGAQALLATEIVVRPAPGLAACVAAITGTAIASLASVQLNPFGVILLCLLALLMGSRAILRLARPQLLLRLEDDGFAYRLGACWSSDVRQPFVSPWFIGWRGRGLTAFGVFRYQLGKDEFRRLARSLRQSGLPLSE